MSFAHKHSLLLKLKAVFFCAAIAVPVQAQYTVGRLEGTIFDTTGAVVTGTKVALRDLGTDATRTYVTGPDGLYVFFALPAGEYELAAEAPRFRGKLKVYAYSPARRLRMTSHCLLASSPKRLRYRAGLSN